MYVLYQIESQNELELTRLQSSADLYTQRLKSLILAQRIRECGLDGLTQSGLSFSKVLDAIREVLPPLSESSIENLST